MAHGVTLHVRVWIEIPSLILMSSKSKVTLHVRVWIEIANILWIAIGKSCHPPREGVD